jgi:hypothetical protein
LIPHIDHFISASLVLSWFTAFDRLPDTSLLNLQISSLSHQSLRDIIPRLSNRTILPPTPQPS